MNSAIKTLIGLLAALLALSGVASAQVAECPECDEDVPANDDCRYSSVDTGYVGENLTQLVDTDLCVANADDERGFWAVFSLCLTTILNGLNEAVGIFANVNIFTSEHGVDVDATVSTPLGDVDLEDTPAGDLDDATWQHLGELNGESHPLPVGGDALPEDLVVNECVYGTELLPCEN